MAPVIQRIVDQHAEDAAFLWLLRDRAVAGPTSRLRELARLDERVEASVDGLRVAGEPGWRTAADALSRYPEPGEAFAAAVLAVEDGDPRRIGLVLEAAGDDPELRRPLVSALGWGPAGRVDEMVAGLFASPEPRRRALALAACSARRVDPGRRLAAFAAEGPETRAPTLHLAGALGRVDLLGVAVAAIADEDPACRFQGAWASALLGDRRSAPEALRSQVEAGGPDRARAFEVALRIMDKPVATAWLRRLRETQADDDLVVAGAGIIGDPAIVPWLIRQMDDPRLARQAGQSFTMITGADLGAEGLAAAAGDDEVAGDGDLPVPDAAAVQAWWQGHREGLADGGRYLGGKPATPASLREVLATGAQHLRRAAALDLALAAPAAPLFNCSARADVQARALSSAHRRAEG